MKVFGHVRAHSLCQGHSLFHGGPKGLSSKGGRPGSRAPLHLGAPCPAVCILWCPQLEGLVAWECLVRTIPVGMYWSITMVLLGSSLVSDDVELFSMYLIDTCLFYVHVFCIFLLYCLFSDYWVLIIWYRSPLSGVGFANISCLWPVFSFSWHLSQSRLLPFRWNPII